MTFYLILFIAFVVCLIFAKWVGIPFSWVFSIIANNNYGAVILFFLVLLVIFSVTGLGKRHIGGYGTIKRKGSDKL